MLLHSCERAWPSKQVLLEYAGCIFEHAYDNLQKRYRPCRPHENRHCECECIYIKEVRSDQVFDSVQGARLRIYVLSHHRARTFSVILRLCFKCRGIKGALRVIRKLARFRTLLVYIWAPDSSGRLRMGVIQLDPDSRGVHATINPYMSHLPVDN